MRTANSVKLQTATLPSWVPEPALMYLRHTETGAPIRALARHVGRHASTVLRQIRRYEARRDDVLVDLALRRLGQKLHPKPGTGSLAKENAMPLHQESEPTLTEDRLDQEALRILRRLCEKGALLAVAQDMPKAVVVRDTDSGTSTRTAVVDREVAEALALKEWIGCDAPGRVARYHITRAGRQVLNQLVARAENAASGFTETQNGFLGGDDAERPGVPLGQSAARHGPLHVSETPLIALARRRDRDGQKFLSRDLVRAGERLREDYELAQIAGDLPKDWDSTLTERGESIPVNNAVAQRVEHALCDLGPGLGDIALSCCCHLEGLERAEKRMGWSARSGKIVLRIALQRLKRHYDTRGPEGDMIG